MKKSITLEIDSCDFCGAIEREDDLREGRDTIFLKNCTLCGATVCENCKKRFNYGIVCPTCEKISSPYEDDINEFYEACSKIIKNIEEKKRTIISSIEKEVRQSIKQNLNKNE